MTLIRKYAKFSNKMKNREKAAYFIYSTSTADRNKTLTANPDSIGLDTLFLEVSMSPLFNVIKMHDDQICMTPNLQILDISGENGILAKQWVECGSYKYLKKLILTDSSQHHSIIEEFLDRAVSLRYLSLRNIKLSTIPVNISNLQNIEFLDLSFNQIEEINSLMFLSSLQKLILDFNKIKRIERANFHARSLQHLSIMGNSVQKVTMDLIAARQLKYIDLSNNGITIFPCELLLLESIKVINCSHNLINTIPIITFLGKQIPINLIDISYNKLHILPYNMITRTEILDLTHNKISKLRPKYFRKLSNKISHKLYLTGNPIEGLSADIYENGLSTIIRHFKYNYASHMQYLGTSILLVGNANSGKSTLIHSIVQDHGVYSEYRPSVGISLYDEVELLFEDNIGNKISVNTNFVELAGSPSYRGPLEDFYNQISIVWLVVNMRQYELYGFETCVKPWLDILAYHSTEKHIFVVCTHKDICKTDSTQIIEKIRNQIEKYVHFSFEFIRNLKTLMINADSSVPAFVEFTRRISLISTKPILNIHYVEEASSTTMIGVEQLVNKTKQIIRNYFPNALKLVPTRWFPFIECMSFIPEDSEESKKSTKMLKFAMDVVPVEQIQNSVASELGIVNQTMQILQYLSESQKIIWNKESTFFKTNIVTNPLIIGDMISKLFHHDIEAFISSLSQETIMDNDFTPKELAKAIGQYKQGIMSASLLYLIWTHHHSDIVKFSKSSDESLCYMQKLAMIRDNFKSIYFKKSKEFDTILLPDLFPPAAIMTDTRLNALGSSPKLNVCFLFVNGLPVGLMAKLIVAVQQKMSLSKSCERWKYGILGYLHKTDLILMLRQFSLESDHCPIIKSISEARASNKDSFDCVEFCIFQTTSTMNSPKNPDMISESASHKTSQSSISSDFILHGHKEKSELTCLWSSLTSILHECYQMITDYQGCPALSLTSCPNCLNYTFGSYWYCHLDLEAKIELKCSHCSSKVDKDYIIPTVPHKNRDQLVLQLMSPK